MGLLLAAELTRHGATCRVVDRSAGSKLISKALIQHVRTQEVMDAAGAIGAMKGEALPLRRVEMHAYGRRVGAWRLDEIDGPHTGPIIIGQNRTEHLLEAHLNGLGVHVEWNSEAIAAEQDEAGVRITVRAGGHDEIVAARYAVGCEGSDSLIRKAAGLTFEGERYTGEQFIQADAKIRWSYPTGASHLFLTEKGYMMVIEMPGDIVRVFVSLPDDDPPRQDDPSLEDVQNALRAMGSAEAELYGATWLARYRTSHRTTNGMRNNRLLLAGDASHIHVPIGGQGMNTGLQDAFNLGWKLAAVAGGSAPERLLDSYDSERLAIAKQLIAGTDRAYRFVLHPGALGRGVARHLGPFILGLDVVQDGFRTVLEEIGLNYRHGPITEDHGGTGDVRAGDRAPDAVVVDAASLETISLFDLMRGTHWTLLLFVGASNGASRGSEMENAAHAAAKLGIRPIIVAQGLETLALEGATLVRDRGGHAHEAYGVDEPALFLIRPDWYIGFRGRPRDAAKLSDYFGRVMAVGS